MIDLVERSVRTLRESYMQQVRAANAGKDQYYLDKVRKDLTISAGYYKQVFERNGIDFEVVALSIKYESMPDDERQVLYKRITQAALDNIFNNGADDNIINQLLSWF